MSSIYDMQFERIMDLYRKRINIEEKNDIKARTLLLEQYPELFDPIIFQEVADAYRQMCTHNSRKSLQ